MYKKSLHWFRRDLRLTDNRALSSAFEKSKCVLLCFIFDTHILNRLKNKKDARVEFILNSLKFISKQLKQKKSKKIYCFLEKKKKNAVFNYFYYCFTSLR